MKSRYGKLLSGLFLTSILAAPAFAQPATGAVAEAPGASPFSSSTVAGDETLEAATAREDISLLATSTQSSNVSGNSINGDSTTGDISFADSAFSALSGLTIVNANSGNNVGMNASINVNIVSTAPATPQ